MRVGAAAIVAACVLGMSGVARADPHVIVPPRRTDAHEVPYPAGAQGDASVLLAIVIDAGGAVTDVSVREGEAPFAEAAMADVRTWAFAPATRDDVPIPARILVRVTFHAPPPPPPPEVRPPPAPPGPPPAARPEEPTDVSVHGEREEPSTIHIPRNETQFVAGAFGDPLKVVEALPGMAPWLSGLPYFYVRGSTPETVGYFIDGIRVPLLFHVGPGASTIAPSLVESVDLFPASYPARYGRYSGAVITAETTSPEAREMHGDFSARVYDANAFVETPFDGGKGSAAVGGRYGYTQLLTSIVVPNYKVGYWDYEARVSHRVFGDDTLSVFAFGAHDELHYKGQTTFDNEYHRVDLRYDHALPRGNLRAAATFQYDDTLTAVQDDLGNVGQSAALRSAGGRGRVEWDERLSRTARIRAGADVLATHYSLDRYPAFDGFPSASGPHTDVEGGAYADVVWRASRTVEVIPGFRFDGYRTRGETRWAPQPRLAVRVQITPQVAWVSAAGVAHQEPTEEILLPGNIPNPINQGSETTYQYSEGLDLRLPSSMTARVSGFYTRLQSLDIVGTGVNGRGFSEGLEVFLRREFTERLGGFLSYTLSRTVGAIGDGDVQRVSWDRTHVVSLVLGYDFGRGWRAGARAFVESGRPMQSECVASCGPQVGAQTAGAAPGPAPAGPPVFITPSGNLPWFWRLDARVEKRWILRSGAWLGATLECFNTFDLAEPVGNQYDSAAHHTVVVTQSPIILPSVGIEGGF